MPGPRTLALLVTASLAACGSGEVELVGTWTLDAEATTARLVGVDLASASEEQRKLFATAGEALQGSIEFTADQRFVAKATVGGQEQPPVAGTWSREGDRVVLMGKTPGSGTDDRQTATLTDGVLVLTTAGPGGKPGQMVYTRTR